MWTIHPTLCSNIVARSLTIRSKTGNGDGIDLDSCQNIRVDNCDIDTGDDCIALKSGRGLDAYRDAKPTENVLITRCKLGDRIFACIGIGSETSGGVRNVRIEHCKFTHANTYSIYIKSHIGRGASIENISADRSRCRKRHQGIFANQSDFQRPHGHKSRLRRQGNPPRQQFCLQRHQSRQLRFPG